MFRGKTYMKPLYYINVFLGLLAFLGYMLSDKYFLYGLLIIPMSLILPFIDSANHPTLFKTIDIEHLFDMPNFLAYGCGMVVFFWLVVSLRPTSKNSDKK